MPNTLKFTHTSVVCVREISSFRKAMEKKNIQTRVVFTGNILNQPGFKNLKAKRNKSGYPEADKVMKNGILIACHHGLTSKMINHIHKSILILFFFNFKKFC